MKTLLAFIVVMILLVFIATCNTPVHSQVNNLKLTWTAPGDDGNVGTASLYFMKWSKTRPYPTVDMWWNKSNNIVNAIGLPLPDTAGTTQSVIIYSDSVNKFVTGNTYYFVIRSVDDEGNFSDYSNIASVFLPDSFPPKPIKDLEVKK